MAAINGVLLWYQCFKKMFWVTFLLVFYFNKGYGLVCFCTESCPQMGHRNGSCVARPNGYCFSAVEEVYDPATGKLEYERSYGCLQAEETGFMQCKGHLVPHTIPQSIACCSEEDWCNKYLKPNIVPQTTPSPMYKGELMSYTGPYHMVTFIISVTVCLCILLVVLICIFIRLKQEKLKRRGYEDVEKKGGGSAVHGLLDKSYDTSGSGSGITLLVQRTIGQQLTKHKVIGQGSFGKVWKATLLDEDVAVKEFFTTEEASWEREKNIYNTVLLRHENILGFKAADISCSDSCTKMVLITDYLELGSLYDYLQTHKLDFVSMLRLAHSASCGIAHLHIEVLGKQGKPAIAHRDIKSRNILVKRDGSCALADFGLAVKYKSDTNELDVAPNARVGTKRYMPPEVLYETIDTSQFDAYRMADMYSFALVLWEIARRCVVNGVVEDYQLPFFEFVPSNPSFEDMKKVVCVDQTRPTIPKHWSNCETMQIMTKVMSECWNQIPGARLTALRVKKTLARLENQHRNQKQPV